MVMSTSKEPSHRPQQHAIGVVCRRTGLSADLLRAWERRYGAVSPTRTPGGHRSYTDSDIERLRLLNEAVRRGHSIGRVADRTDQELQQILHSDAPLPAAQPTDASNPAEALRSTTQQRHVVAREELASILVDECVAAVEALDETGLERCLERASVSFSRWSVIDRLIVPMMSEIGKRWHDGDLRPAHEHLATAVVRSFLGTMRASHSPRDNGLCLLVSTPQHQHHEIGALVAAAVAATHDWRTIYLGPNLPPEELVAAVRRAGAHAVALSITYPQENDRLEDDLRFLRRRLPDSGRPAHPFPILLGGLGAEAYRQVADEIDAMIVTSLSEFRDLLRQLACRG